MEYISNSAEETIEIAKDIASKLNKDDTIVLTRRFRSSEKLNLQREF